MTHQLGASRSLYLQSSNSTGPNRSNILILYEVDYFYCLVVKFLTNQRLLSAQQINLNKQQQKMKNQNTQHIDTRRDGKTCLAPCHCYKGIYVWKEFRNLEFYPRLTMFIGQVPRGRLQIMDESNYRKKLNSINDALPHSTQLSALCCLEQSNNTLLIFMYSERAEVIWGEFTGRRGKAECDSSVKATSPPFHMRHKGEKAIYHWW